jgi:hypothetical protein
LNAQCRANFLLLLASYFFYGWWDWRFLALMIGSTTLDFLLARALDCTESRRARKLPWRLRHLPTSPRSKSVRAYCAATGSPERDARDARRRPSTAAAT